MFTLVELASREFLSRPQTTALREVMAAEDVILSATESGKWRMDMAQAASLCRDGPAVRVP